MEEVRNKEKGHGARKARQIGLSRPYADARPSGVTDVHWIYAVRKQGPYPKPTPTQRQMAYIYPRRRSR
jgi:hypothetical protein